MNTSNLDSTLHSISQTARINGVLPIILSTYLTVSQRTLAPLAMPLLGAISLCLLQLPSSYAPDLIVGPSSSPWLWSPPKSSLLWSFPPSAHCFLIYWLQYHVLVDGSQLYTFRPVHSRSPYPNFLLTMEITYISPKPLRFNLLSLCFPLSQNKLINFKEKSQNGLRLHHHLRFHILRWSLFQHENLLTI